MRLIDGERVEHILRDMAKDKHNQNATTSWANALDDFAEMISGVPTIEAEPVRHGHWNIKTINTFDLAYGTTGYEPVYQCSVCGGVMESYLRLEEPIMPEDASFPRYCPNCGAKMDKEMME